MAEADTRPRHHQVLHVKSMWRAHTYDGHGHGTCVCGHLCLGGRIRERMELVCTIPPLEDEDSCRRVIVLRTRGRRATARRAVALERNRVARAGGAAS